MSIETNDEKRLLNKSIGTKCQQLRKSCGLTQEQLAEKLGVSSQYLSDLERGVYAPSLIKLIKLSDVFSVPTDFFLKETSDTNQEQITIGSRTLSLSEKERQILEQCINLTLQAFEINKD